MPGKQKTTFSRARKLTFVILLFLGALSVASLAFLHTSAAGNWLLGMVDRQLREKHGYTLQAARVRPRPLALAFTLEEVVLKSLQPGESFQYTFKAEKLEINAAWSALLGRELRLQKIILQKPQIETAGNRQTSGKSIKADRRPADSTTAARPLKFRIDRFELHDGSLHFAGETEELNLSASGIRASVEYRPREKSHYGSLDLGAGRISFMGNIFDISSTGLSGRLQDEMLLIDAFRLESGASWIEIHGSLSLFDADPELDLQVNTRLDGREMMTLAGRQIPLSGALSISARAFGLGSELSYHGEIAGLELAADRQPFSLAGNFQGNLQRLEISNLLLGAAGGQARAGAILTLLENDPSRAELSWEKIELPVFSRLLPEFLPVLAASSDGRLEAEWTGTGAANLKATGLLLLNPADADSRPTARQSLSPRGRIEFEAGGDRLNARAKIDIPGVNLQFLGHRNEQGLIGGRLTLTLTEPRLTAASLGLDFPGFMPEISRPVIVQAEISGTVETPRLAAVISSEQISWRDISLDKLEIRTAADRQALSIYHVSGSINSAPLTGSGRLRLKLPEIKPAFDSNFKLELQGLELQPLLALLPGIKQHKTPGSAGLVAVFSHGSKGWQADFQAGADFSPDGTIPLNKIELSGSVSEKELKLERIHCLGELGLLSGSLSLDTKTRSFRTLLQGSEISPGSLHRAFPEFPIRAGRGDFLLEGRGLLEKPEFNLTLVIEELAAGDFLIPLIELEAFSDSRKSQATLSIPSLRLKSRAELILEKPYQANGNLVMDRAQLAAVMKEAGFDSASPAEGELNLELDWALPLMQTEAFGLKGVFSVIDLALPGTQLQDAAKPALEKLEGNFSLAGNPAELQRLQADMYLKKLDLNLAGLPVSMSRPARLNLHEGRLSLDRLLLKSAENEALISGQLQLGPEPEIKAELSLQTEIDIFNSFFTEALFDGRLIAKAEFSGSPADPAIRGRAEFRDLFIRLRDFPLTLTGINSELEFRARETFIKSFTGIANGGSLNVSGRINHAGQNGIEADKIALRLRNFNLSYPEGMATAADADLELNGPWNSLLLSGETRILRGIYRQNIHPGIELINLARYSPDFSPEDIPAPLRHLRLQLSLNSTAPLRIRNNLADIDMEAQLTISGTPAFPVFSGRIVNSAAGRLLIGGRTYTVERLRLEYLGTELMDFNIEVLAHTRLRYDSEDFAVKLSLSGPMADPELDLSYAPTARFPNLSSQDLAFLLLTGKMPADLSGNALDTLGAQMITHFASPFTSPLTEGLKNLLKAEDVIIEPLVIASETDPGARFTFRKRVSQRALFTYSADITRNQRHTWMLDYDLFRSLLVGAFRRDDGSYGASFKHSLQFPGTGSSHRTSISAAAEKNTLSEIRWKGQLLFPEKKLRSLSGQLKPGRTFSHEDLYKAVEKTLNFYRRRGYANVSVTPILDQVGEGYLKAALEIRPGRPAGFVFSGDPIPGKLKREIRSSWLGDFPEQTNLEESVNLILKELKRRKYFAARVEASVEEKQGRVSYRFRVNRGKRYRIAGLTLAGGGPISENRLKRTLSSYLLAPTASPWNLVLDENAALEALRRAYAQQGHLQARISRPRIESDPLRHTLDISLEIDPGPQTLVNQVSLSGNESLSELELRPKLTLAKGSPFNPIRLQEDQNALLTAYRSRGFKNAELDVVISAADEQNEIDLRFEIREGLRHKVAALEVRGRRRTGEKFIIRESGLKLGTPSTLQNFSRAKKRLYDSGAFRTVSITARDTESAEAGQDTVLIEVEEAPLLTLNYGLRYNSEEKIEGHGELNFNNLFGAGRKGFVSYRESSLQRDLRFSMLFPYLFGLKLNTLFSLYNQEESRENIITSTRGLSVQQQISLPLDFTFSYLYRFNRIHTYELESWGPFPFDFTIKLSEIGLSLLRDVRNDRLNPSAGSYFSASLTYAPEYLGSDLPYVSFFSQYSLAREIKRKLVWAAGLRLGLADAFSGELIPGKRFFAGGGNSVRGFRLDSLGPRDPYLDRASGGMALLIVNNELRFPLLGPLGGAVFHDCGNVWGAVSELKPGELRHGAGFGLRLDSPLGLLRLDLGFNLRPRPGESRSVLFFSLGQAF